MDRSLQIESAIGKQTSSMDSPKVEDGLSPVLSQFRDLLVERFGSKPCGTLSTFNYLLIRCSHYKEYHKDEFVSEVHKLFSGHPDVIAQFDGTLYKDPAPLLEQQGPEVPAKKLSEIDMLYSSLESAIRAAVRTVLMNLRRDREEIIFVRKYFKVSDIKFLKKYGLDIKYLSDEYDMKRGEVIKRCRRLADDLTEKNQKIKKVEKSLIRKRKRQATTSKTEELKI